MCGIAGIIDHKHTPEQNLQTLGKMLKTQHHRGPDDTGIWTDNHAFLGHNRLSIIDLSDAANQPMHFKHFTLVYNGEVYNYIEIKKQLEILGHHFTTSSDSEVILHAYEQWGTGCVQQFVGMWAFVIYDSEKKELFASRDRFGIKPFNYIFEDNRFYFASEIKTIKHSPLFSNDLNVNQVSRGLQMGWLGYFDETYYSKVKALPAAHNLLFSLNKFEITEYWQLQTGKYSNLSFEEKRQTFYDLFADSISIHLRSDVPVASCLSGGLDSSAIVSMVQRLHPGMKYKSFSIFYEGDGDVDERPFIREVIKRYPAIEPHYFSPSNRDVQDSFHHALYHADVPVTGSSFVSQYFLMKMIAADGYKVVLDGQGADEFLGGYMHTFYRLIAGMLKRYNFIDALSTTNAINKRIGNTNLKSLSHFGKSLLAATMSEQQLYDLEYKKYYPFMVNHEADFDDSIKNKPHPKSLHGAPAHTPAPLSKNQTPFNLKEVPGTRMDQFLYHLIQNTSLPSLLHYEDRNSMAFSVESRVPFLDHRLVEFCFGLNDDDKIKGIETKFILREAMKTILPDAIYARKDKKGFVTPGENKWLRGPLSFLMENEKGLPDFIDKQKASTIFKDYHNGDNSKATLVWRLAVLGEWGKG